MISFVFLTILMLNVNLGSSKQYRNYTLFRSVPLEDLELEFLKNLSKLYTVDFWRPPGLLYNPVEFLIAPKDKKSFKRQMDDRKYYYTTVISDVQKAFDSQTVKTYERRKMDSFDWKSFFRLEDIYGWVTDLAKNHPDKVTVKSIGDTSEGRNILAVSVNTPGGAEKRSTVIVEGGIHAREWIAPAFVTYMLNEIANSDRSPNKELKNIARLYNWQFVPVLNPDGYEYSHTKDRMWRKNRSEKHGVDINRNFDIGFKTVGVSTGTRDQTYCGKYAFSEKESAAMKNFTHLHSENLEYYLAFHSYGQYMIIPYAHSKQHLDNYDELVKILMQVRQMLARRHGTKYTAGTAYDTVGYETSGVSGCWAKATYRVPYVVTFELRDSGRYGFALPPSQILPTCIETMDAMLTLLKPKTHKFRKIPMSQFKRITDDGQAINFPNLVLNIFLIETVFLF